MNSIYLMVFITHDNQKSLAEVNQYNRIYKLVGLIFGEKLWSLIWELLFPKRIESLPGV
jgi:hypothetical protein